MINTPFKPAKYRIEQGFTIVELMIATLVFSVILTVITSGVTHFTADYYKGINSSKTQNISRSIIDTISQAIQFSANGPSATPAVPAPIIGGFICAGSQEFSYNLGSGPVDEAGTVKGLVQYTITPGTCVAPPAIGGTELLQPHMRLTKFAVTSPANNGIWNISVGVAYADTNDLLCNAAITPATADGGCDSGSTSLTNNGVFSAAGNLHCKSQTGSQFCDVSVLNTTAQRRVNTP